MLSREDIPTYSSGGRRRLTAVAIALLAVYLFLRQAAVVWTDYLWFDATGFTEVWWVRFSTQAVLIFLGTLVAFLVLWLNLLLASRLSPRVNLLIAAADGDELLERVNEWAEPRLRRLRLALAGVFAILNGLSVGLWRDQALRFLNPKSFGISDPIFDTDVGFYLFSLPMYRTIVNWLFPLLILTTFLVLGVHYINGGIRLRPGRAPEFGPGVKVHVSVLLAVIALVRAAAYRLDAFELLLSTTGVVQGAGYSDVVVRRPALNLLLLISLAAAALLLYNIRRRGWTLPAVAVGSWLVVSIVVGGLIPTIVQRFTVEPNEARLELQYVDNNLEFTRMAYGLSDIAVAAFSGDGDLGASDIAENRPTIDNLRLWDPAVLNETYAQRQEIRTYYELAPVDTDRYVLDGQLTQVMVATREVDDGDLPAPGWVIDKLVYSHGYGAVLSTANEVGEQGAPAFLVEDVPPISRVPELEVEQPGIYFGETYDSRRFIVANTNEPEVDFPLTEEGASFQPSNYAGEGGVELTSFWRRLAFAIRFTDLNTLISPQIESESRVLFHRNIRDRVSEVVPYLAVDDNPYVAVVDGRLVWIVDLYTVSRSYPYSTRADTRRLATTSGVPANINYIRNSVKATVDAYDGTITLYVVDADDPLIQSYQDIYPNTFRSFEDMDAELLDHVRYPEDLFRIQSDIYVDYHVTDAELLYNSEDEWRIPGDPSNSDRGTLRGDGPLPTPGESRQRLDTMLPYYLLMRLPGEEDLSYLIMQPFNPANRPTMASFLVARSDPEEYGQLVEYRLPRTVSVNGPDLVRQLRDQDTQISQQRTLWDQQGSSVIFGNMLVVPIADAIVYVQPVYLKAEAESGQNDQGLPEFKQAIVVYKDRIAMEQTLDGALTAVFGQGVGSSDPIVGPDEPPDEPIVGTVAALLAEAEAAFSAAQDALASGDLAEYQSNVDRARNLVMQALELASEGSPEA